MIGISFRLSLKMFLHRNILVFLLIACSCVRGEPEDVTFTDPLSVIDKPEDKRQVTVAEQSSSSNFLHEVYVDVKPDTNTGDQQYFDFEPRVGCIINDGHGVLVNQFKDPSGSAVFHLRIKYKDGSGSDAYADVEKYEETESRELLLLIPDKPIPLSAHANAATLLEVVNSDVLLDYTVKVNPVLTMSQTDLGKISDFRFLMERSYFLKIEYANKEENKVDAPKGSTVVALRHNERPIVVGMFQTYKSEKYYSKLALIFSTVDTGTTKIITPPSASPTTLNSASRSNKPEVRKDSLFQKIWGKSSTSRESTIPLEKI